MWLDLLISASSYVIGGIIGSLLGGYFGGRFGPKRTILASCVPAALGWILISSSPHLSTLILGRILCGLSAECITSNCPLLVAEYRYIDIERVTPDMFISPAPSREGEGSWRCSA